MNTSIKGIDVVLFVLLFCYVFAFFIGPISISLLIAVPLYGIICINSDYYKGLLDIINSDYIKYVFIAWSIIVLFGSIHPIVLSTFDFSFEFIVLTQALHFIAALPVFTFLYINNVTHNKVERYFVFIFVLQTIIQVIVVNSSYLSDLILQFNHFDPDSVIGIGSGVRGKALSAATTYHLSMAYGICFIIYVKDFFSAKASIVNTLIGILLFVGIFFAGRTGFVACLIGFIGFFLYRYSIGKIIKMFKALLIVIVFVSLTGVLLFLYSPEFYELINEQLLPYAFEFLYSMSDGGTAETASTNRLMEMWNDSNFDSLELLFGSGKYSNTDGSYYMHVDPGVLRHMLYMGVVGYLLLLVYQLMLLPVWRFKGRDLFYYSLVFLFLCIMDFKCVNIGVNKFVFSISLLLSFSSLVLKREDELSLE